MTRLARLAALVLLSGAPLIAQPPPKLEVLSPVDEAYVSGSVKIEARLVPMAAERQVVEMSFFANGVTVCTVARPPFTCIWNAGPTVRAHQLRVVAELPGGVRLAQTVRTRGVDHAESAGVTAVQVTASVKDGRGRFVAGLTPADFSVFDSGIQQVITGFAAEQSDVTLALALDTSGSMEHVLPDVKVQAKAFLQALPSSWPVSVLSFDNTVFVVAPPGVPAEDRGRTIDGLKAWGGTALYTAIVRALAQVQTGSGRKAVVVFTDGQDRNSTIDAKEVRSAIEASEAAVYFVAAGEAARSREMSKILDELAEISGGRVLRGRDTDDIERAFAEVREEIRNQYLLTYVPRQLGRPGTYRPLSVKVTCRGCRVRARAGYTVQGPRR